MQTKRDRNYEVGYEENEQVHFENPDLANVERTDVSTSSSILRPWTFILTIFNIAIFSLVAPLSQVPKTLMLPLSSIIMNLNLDLES